MKYAANEADRKSEIITGFSMYRLDMSAKMIMLIQVINTANDIRNGMFFCISGYTFSVFVKNLILSNITRKSETIIMSLDRVMRLMFYYFYSTTFYSTTSFQVWIGFFSHLRGRRHKGLCLSKVPGYTEQSVYFNWLLI